jgi:transposase
LHGTTTWVGIDVHARSTHLAAIDSITGELRRARFGPGLAPVVDWLGELARPVRAAYEAGPTGYGLARMASAAGIEIAVVAPSKTPRRHTTATRSMTIRGRLTDRRPYQLRLSTASRGLLGSSLRSALSVAPLDPADASAEGWSTRLRRECATKATGPTTDSSPHASR